MKKIAVLAVCLLSVFVTPAQALLLDLNGLYFQDTMTATSTTTTSRTLGDVALAIGLDQDKMFNIGFSILSAVASDQTGSTKNEWSTFDYGLRFVTYFNRTKEWGIDLTYNPYAKGKYTPAAGTAEEWRGSSFLVSLGYTPLVIHTMFFGLRLNYYSASYTETSIAGGPFVSQTVTRSFVYPSIFFSVRL